MTRKNGCGAPSALDLPPLSDEMDRKARMLGEWRKLHPAASRSEEKLEALLIDCEIGGNCFVPM